MKNNTTKILMRGPISAAVALLALTSTAVQAADMRTLTRDCEIALALSAGPASVQEGAAVYILGDKGYEMVRESTNGYTCFVERNHYDSVIPECFYESARASNVQIIFDEGAMLRAGATWEDILKHRKEALETDEYPVPGFGVAYMLSEFNYIWRGDYMVLGAPHVMFPAPYINYEDISITIREAIVNRGMPFINAPGKNGLFVSFVDHGSDPTAVNEACAGQLPSREEMVPFPPVRKAAE